VSLEIEMLREFILFFSTLFSFFNGLVPPPPLFQLVKHQLFLPERYIEWNTTGFTIIEQNQGCE
jgi:hypothetical protein